MKKRILRFAALTLAVLSITSTLSGCYFLPKEEEILEPPLKEPEAVTYKTHTVTEGVLERYLSGTGRVESTESEVLYYQSVSGRLKSINVKSGAEVKAGDLLVELDVGDLEYTIYKQEKAVRQAELTLEIAKKVEDPDPVALERAQINYDLAARDLENSRAQLTKTSGTDARKAVKETIYRQERNLRLMELALEEAKKPRETDPADIERAQISYDLAVAQLEQYQKQLEESRLYASMDGLVTFVAKIEPGDPVSTYYDLVKIAKADSLRITMPADDTEDLYLGMEMEVTFGGNKEESYTGRIVQLPSDVPITASEEERKAIKIDLDQFPEKTKIGDSVNVNVLLERKEGIITLPLRYVSTYSSRRYVRVLNEEGIPEERDVKLGSQNISTVEIVSGLEAGEVIVI